MISQAMPRMRASLPKVHVSRSPWRESEGRFRQLKRLGRGSFGMAFSALLGKKKVIVKIVHPDKAVVSPAEAFESLRREMVILGKLQRFPFIPRIVEVGPNYFVQEDVGGVAMLDLLMKKGLEPREILSVVVSTGVMASLLHQSGIAHRDLEPRNILLSPTGVVLIDFGMAVEKKESKDWKEDMSEDVKSIIGILALVRGAPSLPPVVRNTVEDTLSDFRSRLTRKEISEFTSAEMAREIFFASSQMNVRHARNRKLREAKVKV